jgi:aspartyl-tRNA(Asn)/glutamyl-tRNA(Gln) amidotransferase subunit A
VTVRELGSLLRSGQVSCAELVEQTIRRSREHEELRAFITVTESQAREQAQERDRELKNGVDRGPFHGIPIAYKDLFYTKGVRTTAGSLLFKDFIPNFDGTVVERLQAAGAISIGKTNLHELAFGITSLNPHYGPVLNPRDPARLAGGSSGGSAAVIVAQIVPLAMGTDTGGSIRIPASYCGVVGLKPTYGRVSRHGILPLAFSLDHVGPLGSCVEDCALAMNVMAGRDPLDFTSAAEAAPDFNLPALPDFKNVRVGVPRNFFFDRLDEEVEKSVKHSISAIEQQGATVEEIQIPEFTEINLASRVVQLGEFASLYTDSKDRSMFGDDVWSLLEQARMVAAHEYINAQRLRTLFRRDMDAVWRKVDILAAPTTPIAAPLRDAKTLTMKGIEETVRMTSIRLVRGLNYLGEPALSMPCGQTDAGMPIGLQLISAPFTEPRLLQFAKTLEALLGRFPFER